MSVDVWAGCSGGKGIPCNWMLFLADRLFSWSRQVGFGCGVACIVRDAWVSKGIVLDTFIRYRMVLAEPRHQGQEIWWVAAI